jgi:DNA-binding CsgD family transcriptional regulator
MYDGIMAFKAGVSARLEQSRTEVIAAYRGGASLDDLAGTYECSHTPLRSLLKRHGVPLRANRRRRVLADREDQVRKMYSDGMSTREIAAALNVDRNTVSEFVHRLGVRRPTPLRSRTFRVESDADRGMIAGLLLGEGSIVIRANGDPVVRIVNTDRDIIEMLARFGGRVHWVKPRRGCPKPLGTWDIARRVDVLHFLHEIGPLLVGVKRDRADRALAVLRDRHGLRPGLVNHD